MPRSSQSKSIPASAAIRCKWPRASMARRTVVTVFSSWRGMAAMNSAIHESLCQDGFGFTSKGAPGLNIQRSPLSTVAQLFQTSAFEADSCPPLANEVSMAA